LPGKLQEFTHAETEKYRTDLFLPMRVEKQFEGEERIPVIAESGDI